MDASCYYISMILRRIRYAHLLRTTLLFLMIFFVGGCGGSGGKRLKTESANFPSLQPGPIVTVATGSGASTPEILFPPSIVAESGSPESKNPGDTFIVWSTQGGIQGALYNGTNIKLAPTSITPTSEANFHYSYPSISILGTGSYFVAS